MKILAVIGFETARAYLCSGARWDPKGYYDVDGLIVNEFWLPKSQVQKIEGFVGKAFIGEEFLCVLEVPTWLAKAHNLAKYEWDNMVRKTKLPLVNFIG